MKKVLVTGGAGYIGAVLVPMLLDKGFQVTVTDNFMHQNNSSLVMCCVNPNFDAHSIDIRDYDTMETLYCNHDVIIPLASIVGAKAVKCDPQNSASTTTAAMRMVGLIPKDKLIIMPTTNSGYGTHSAIVTEETPIKRGSSQYVQEKMTIESSLMCHPGAVSLRLASCYGMSPRFRPDLLLNNLVWRAVVDRHIDLFEADCIRDFIHVRDVCRFIIHCINHSERVMGQIYNVGECNMTKREVVEIIQKKVQQQSFPADCLVTFTDKGKDPDARDAIISHQKMERTGFLPMYCLPLGIEELLTGYQMLAG
tara:strand:+ start:874 stop:1800 length:927 start_codon:yes stop_codon:yes gene_type:complete